MNGCHHLPVDNIRGRFRSVTYASSTISDRLELFDLLQGSLTIALNMLNHTTQAQHELCNVSFISLQKLFHRIAQANLEYVELLGSRIRDLGGVSEPSGQMATHFPGCESRTSGTFAACIDGINSGAIDLNKLDAQLHLGCSRIIGSHDLASVRLLETYQRRTRAFTSLIRDNLACEDFGE